MNPSLNGFTIRVISRVKPEVMDGDLWVLTDNFILIIDVGGGEVDHDVNNKHNIN